MGWLRQSYWLALLLAMTHPIVASATCDPVPREGATSLTRKRPIVATDLVELRDIGVANALSADSPLGVSPDGAHVAFVIARADADENDYCFALVVLALEPGARPLIVDRGGEPIRAVLDVRGLRVKQGYLRINRPLWSPDGKWVLYLRREQGVTQLWRVASDGSIREPVTRGNSDVERFGWTPNGTGLIVSRLSSRGQGDRQREKLTGFAYDDRFVPSASSEPFDLVSNEEICTRVDLSRPGFQETASVECGTLSAPQVASTAQRAILQAQSGSRRAWTEQSEPDRLLSPIMLWADDKHGRKVQCKQAACIGSVEVGIEGLWWSHDSDVLYLRREGWGRSKGGRHPDVCCRPTIFSWVARRPVLAWSARGTPAPNPAGLCSSTRTAAPHRSCSIRTRNLARSDLGRSGDSDGATHLASNAMATSCCRPTIKSDSAIP
jgi:hypothetical protein